MGTHIATTTTTIPTQTMSTALAAAPSAPPTPLALTIADIARINTALDAAL